jgi:hypothetical protein
VAKRYTLVEGDLYRCGTNGVLMRRVTQEGGYELLTEIHGVECGNHASSHTLVGKAFRDVVELVKRCKACQIHTKQIHTPVHTLQMISPSWPFVVSGLDILGSFHRVIRGFQYLYVIVDKFTKWPEATPVSRSTSSMQSSLSSQS